jgi:hypothetical protein
MRARSLRLCPDVPGSAPEPRAPPVRGTTRAALVFLRCRDADGRLRELVRARVAVRPRLGALEQLSTWEAAEAIAVEAASALGAPEIEEGDRSHERSRSRSRHARRAESSECGLRAVRWPWLCWDPPSAQEDAESLESDLADATPLDLDHRFRAAIAFLQRVDLEIGRILRQVVTRALYGELGFERFEDYVAERLDLSPRTARRLVRLARAPEPVATAFREGRITLLAAEAILRGAPLDETLTLRRLQEQVRPEIDFWAPPDVARLFLAMVARVGLESLLDHAIATWLALAPAITLEDLVAGLRATDASPYALS